MTADLSGYFLQYKPDDIVFKNSERAYSAGEIKALLENGSLDYDNSIEPFIDVLQEFNDTGKMNFSTSGSTAESKSVKSALRNLLIESRDMQEEFDNQISIVG